MGVQRAADLAVGAVVRALAAGSDGGLFVHGRALRAEGAPPEGTGTISSTSAPRAAS
ncbi:hypothetical protein [Streptomyces malaysiensis]|uniref:hypothetical protein n=1 Tax=Streptomyces malaysiensis TaxID=92644 RepID=UPI0032204AE7|nr:hypothetical protein [Streptomyces malaysiensis]